MHNDTQNSSSTPRPIFNRSQLLARFFETSPILMGVVELENDEIRHVLDNEESAKFFNLPLPTMEGRLASELGIARENLDLWIAHYKLSEKINKPVSFEYLHGESTLSVKVSFLEKTEAGASRFSYIAQDVSEMRNFQRKLEGLVTDRSRELEIQKTKLDCLLKASPVGIAFLDTELRYELINPIMAAANGELPENHLKKKVEEIIPDSSDSLIPLLKEVLATGRKVVNWEYESFSKVDHEKRHNYLANYFPVMMDQKTIGVGAIVTDITQQVQARKILQDEHQSFQEIANTLPQVIWLARPDGFIYWYSDWYYDYTGLSHGHENWEVPEHSPIHPEDFPELASQWQHALQTGEPTYIHFRIRRSDGEYRWHLSRGVPLRDESGKITKWIGSNTDVHDNRLLLEKLEEEQEGRERFVATLSHDLRTPLTAAKMSAQIIARKASDLDIVTRSSARIVENMNRADVMIRDILDTNRIKAGEKIALEFGNCNLGGIIIEALDDLRTLHGDRFMFQDGKEIEGNWSCSGIRRILENLCNNAIKYGSAHDPVTITLSDIDDHVLLQVHNEGNPIPGEEQKKLFDPYRRAESVQVSKQRGWGLGLTLVKGIAEAHGGHVSVTSSGDEGTTFTVYLPKHFEKPK